MILVCGGLADAVTELVCARLEDCGFPYRLLDLGHYPAGYKIKWQWRGSEPIGYISAPDWRLDLDQISGVFIRYLGPEARIPPSEISSEYMPLMYSEYDTGLMVLLEELPCLVVNRIGGGTSNNSKVYQAMLVQEYGLQTPPTLVTNDPQAAQRFYDTHQGEVIYKSLSGIRSIVRRIDTDQMTRFPLLRHGPAQFQVFIPGENVRVHTVGDQVFATRVRSQSVDYRYAHRENQDVEMEPVTLPVKIADACLRLAHGLGLMMSGIDLKVTPDGDYYCFEVNPSPGFLYYEKYSGQPISLALAKLLQNGLASPISFERSMPMR
jgi:glutathione synthase/RimK-type ligase-like ATP-grasp enzyme